MTREEEIKERLKTQQPVYLNSVEGITQAYVDINYLLARNEELQRRVEKMEAVVEAAKFDRKELHHPECKCHFCEAVDAIDAADESYLMWYKNTFQEVGAY